MSAPPPDEFSEEEGEWDPLVSAPTPVAPAFNTQVAPTFSTPAGSFSRPGVGGFDLNSTVPLMRAREMIWAKRQQAIQEKEAAQERKIMHVKQLARECGATEETPLLWLGVLKIIQDETVMEFFIASKPEGRMTIIKHYAKEDVESAPVVNESYDSDDDFDELVFSMLLEDEFEEFFLYSMYKYAMHVDKYC